MTSPSKLIPTGLAPEHEDAFDILKGIKLTTIDIVGGIYCHICHLTFGNKKEFDSHYVKHGVSNNDLVYTCVVCYKEFVGYPSFRGHCYLVHVNKDKYKCEHCSRLFSKHCVLQAHMKNVHETNYKCEICQKEFNSKKELAIHKSLHKTQYSPPYDCHVCGEKLETTDDCEYHVDDHCSMFYSCPICNEEIVDIQNASCHLVKHFGDLEKKDNTHFVNSESNEIPNDSSIDFLGGIFCIYCDNTHKTRVDFDNHCAAEHPEKDIVYACNICGKECDKYLMLASHCYNHTTKDRFQCEECSKTFDRLAKLVLHMDAFHSDSRPVEFPFSCAHCGHRFKSHLRLKDHVNSKHNIYKFQCQETGCGQIFAAPKDLMFHLQEHSSVGNRCQQCGLRFYSMQACEKHLQFHKKKLYSCPICNRQYSEKYMVMKHLNQHFSSVFHACKICNKIYSHRNRLVEHMKVHNEVRPFVCSFCSKGFTKNYLLKQHLNVHTGQKPFKCTVCPKTFASDPNLRKHLRNIHDVRLERRNITNENKYHNRNEEVGLQCSLADENFEASIIDTVMLDNNNIEENLQQEQAIEMFVDMSNVIYNFDESSESCSQWSAEVDPMLQKVEGEGQVNMTTLNLDNVQNELWVNTSAILEASRDCQPLVPREYGPEFVTGGENARAGDIRLDDAPLPHIDPRLTLLPQQDLNQCLDFPHDDAQHWANANVYDARAQIYPDVY
ncbi:hypothetical protein ACJJTC_016798 [Scirpophaga incertulas]